MIRILYFTDTHIRAQAPTCRIDDFEATVYKKISEIRDIGKARKVDFYIHGGDLFDRPDPPMRIVRTFGRLFQTFERPVFFVPGNHDIFAYNLRSLDRTFAAIWSDFGLLHILSQRTLLSIDGTSLQLTSAPYTFLMDQPEGKQAYIVSEKVANFAIHITHGLLLPKRFEGVSHTLIDDISDTKADLTLCGHYHSGFKTILRDGKLFANPGSVSRMSATKAEMERKPKVLLITLQIGTPISLENIDLQTAPPGNTVFSRASHDQKEEEGRLFESIRSEIQSGFSSDRVQVEQILLDIAKAHQISKEVRDHALHLIEEVRSEPS